MMENCGKSAFFKKLWFYVIFDYVIHYGRAEIVIVFFSRYLQQEQEEHANKPLSDTNEDEEKPKNLSIAQIIYAENRVTTFLFIAAWQKKVTVGSHKMAT